MNAIAIYAPRFCLPLRTEHSVVAGQDDRICIRWNILVSHVSFKVRKIAFQILLVFKKQLQDFSFWRPRIFSFLFCPTNIENSFSSLIVMSLFLIVIDSEAKNKLKNTILSTVICMVAICIVTTICMVAFLAEQKTIQMPPIWSPLSFVWSPPSKKLYIWRWTVSYLA